MDIGNSGRDFYRERVEEGERCQVELPPIFVGICLCVYLHLENSLN